MFEFIKNIFGFGAQVDYAQLVRDGAIILDVRSKAEYQDGHIKDSVNISLDTLSNHLNRLKKDKPIITCCASGIRSSSARSILRSNGFAEVYNGGGWRVLQNKIT